MIFELAADGKTYYPEHAERVREKLTEMPGKSGERERLSFLAQAVETLTTIGPFTMLQSFALIYMLSTQSNPPIEFLRCSKAPTTAIVPSQPAVDIYLNNKRLSREQRYTAVIQGQDGESITARIFSDTFSFAGPIRVVNTASVGSEVTVRIVKGNFNVQQMADINLPKEEVVAINVNLGSCT